MITIKMSLLISLSYYSEELKKQTHWNRNQLAHGRTLTDKSYVLHGIP
jgi:hypothetical protein